MFVHPVISQELKQTHSVGLYSVEVGNKHCFDFINAIKSKILRIKNIG